MSVLTLYIKPTNYCNIDCDHCYLPLSTRADKRIMSDETLLSVTETVKGLCDREGHDEVNFIFHGGEPLILSPKWYENAFNILDNELGRDNYFSSLQTSLIPYRKEWAPLVRERFDSWIGSSIDFTQRKVKGSTENYIDLWMQKVELARSEGFYVMPGMVPTRHEVDKAKNIVDWMCDHDFPSFNIDRFSRYGNENNFDWPNNAQHASFMISLFDSVIGRVEKGERAPYVNVLAAGINGVLFDAPGDRWGTTCQRTFLVIEPDGSTNSCPDRATHEEPFANINDGAASLMASPGRRNWIRVADVTHKESHCLTCEYRSFCKSGCPVTPNGPANGQDECSGYKSFLKHVENYCLVSSENRERAIEYARPPS